MKITKQEQYLTVTPEKKSDFNLFFNSFTEKIKEFESQNIILDLSETLFSLSDILNFKNISEEKVGLGTTFVVIYSEIDIDEIPDELIVVPTFQEAIDMIEMDEMTRSLDF